MYISYPYEIEYRFKFNNFPFDQLNTIRENPTLFLRFDPIHSHNRRSLNVSLWALITSSVSYIDKRKKFFNISIIINRARIFYIPRTWNRACYISTNSFVEKLWLHRNTRRILTWNLTRDVRSRMLYTACPYSMLVRVRVRFGMHNVYKLAHPHHGSAT